MARTLWPALMIAGLAVSPLSAQTQRPVAETMSAGANAVAQAEALVAAGKNGDATELLGRYLSATPNDGHAWFFLGQIYLESMRNWHTHGHTGEPSGALMIDFAGVAFDQSSQLLTDSGSVFRTLVSVERATSWVEEAGWDNALVHLIDPAEVPLPPVVAELGRNLMASCPANGVLLTGNDLDLAAVWGVQLLERWRNDLILLRPDRYRSDPVYRGRMSRLFGVDSTATLATLIGKTRSKHTVCLSPAVDTAIAPALGWKPSRMVMAVGGAKPRDISVLDLSVHQLARLGLSGSVWSSPVRDLYDLAARFNHSLCASVFSVPGSTLPAIAACRS